MFSDGGSHSYRTIWVNLSAARYTLTACACVQALLAYEGYEGCEDLFGQWEGVGDGEQVAKV